jgi:hypothetical protein
MTRRERLERKLEKRQDWANGAERRAEQRFNTAHHALDGIEPGQPILVGHHSESKHRRALARHDANMRKGFEECGKAKHHASKADGLQRQLDKSIFTDDPDAVEALEARIAELEREADRESAINKAWRKGKGKPGWADDLGISDKYRETIEDTMRQCPWLKSPCFSGNTRANIRRLKKRLEDVQRRQAKQARTEAAGGVLIEDVEMGYTVVTFSEKPDRDILNELKAAGYRWGRGSWSGKTDALPESVKALASA